MTIKIYLWNNDDRSSFPIWCDSLGYYENNKWLAAHNFIVYPTKGNIYAYAEALKKYWGRGEDIIIMENDMRPTVAQLEDLDSCRAIACTFLYYGMWEHQVYNLAGIYLKDQNNNPINVRIDQLPYAVDYANFSGTGFCKISRVAQRYIPLSFFDNRHWSGIDTAISNELYKNHISWHLHKSFVEHDHFQDDMFK